MKKRFGRKYNVWKWWNKYCSSKANLADNFSKFNASTSGNEPTINNIQSKFSGLGIKDERYIKKRGWSIDSIKDVIKRPHTTRKAFNKSTGNQATVYYNKQGDYETTQLKS